MKRFLLSSAAVAALSASALAADLPARTKAPAVAAPAFTWAGGYVGAVAGFGQNTHSTPNYYYGDGTGSSTGTGFGGTIGATAGYNFQQGNFVYGIEGDFSLSNLAQKSYNEYYDGAYYGHEGKWNSIATLRGRVGLTVGSTLAYFTGGLAMVNVKAGHCYYGKGTCGSSEYDVLAKGWKAGLAVGGGIEHAVTNNVSLKAEYLYVGLRSYDSNSEYYNGGDYNRQTFTSSAQLVRLGVNYKF